VTYTRHETVARRLDTLLAMGQANARMKITEDRYRRLFVFHYNNITTPYIISCLTLPNARSRTLTLAAYVLASA
jgi:hypothetical protein